MHSCALCVTWHVANIKCWQRKFISTRLFRAPYVPCAFNNLDSTHRQHRVRWMSKLLQSLTPVCHASRHNTQHNCSRVSAYDTHLYSISGRTFSTTLQQIVHIQPHTAIILFTLQVMQVYMRYFEFVQNGKAFIQLVRVLICNTLWGESEMLSMKWALRIRVVLRIVTVITIFAMMPPTVTIT